MKFLRKKFAYVFFGTEILLKIFFEIIEKSKTRRQTLKSSCFMKVHINAFKTQNICEQKLIP